MAVTLGLTYEQKEAERKLREAEKFEGLDDINLNKAMPKRKGLTPAQARAELERKEREVRPEGWKASISDNLEAQERAEKILRNKEIDLRREHMLRSPLKALMWQVKDDELAPNIHMYLFPEYGIDTDFSGAFTTRAALQTWLDQHPLQVLEAISKELNKQKKFTKEQEALSKQVQQLIIDSKH